MPLWDKPAPDRFKSVSLFEIYEWIKELLFEANIPDDILQSNFIADQDSIRILYPPRDPADFISMSIVPSKQPTSSASLNFRNVYGVSRERIESKADLEAHMKQYMNILDPPKPPPPTINRDTLCKSKQDIEKVIKFLGLRSDSCSWSSSSECFVYRPILIYPTQTYPQDKNARVVNEINRFTAEFFTNGDLIDMIRHPPGPPIDKPKSIPISESQKRTFENMYSSFDLSRPQRKRFDDGEW